MNAVGINVSKGKRLKQFNLSTIPKKSAQEQAPLKAGKIEVMLKV